MERHTIFDWSRKARTGIPEAIFAEGKALSHLHDVIREHIDRNAPLLITRLTPAQIDGLRDLPLSVDDLGRTATLDAPEPDHDAPVVAIVTAGTSDLSVAREAEVAANFMGLRTELIADVGVAGLWRLEAHLPTLTAYRLIIAVAGMEGALFSVLAGLVTAPIIAVPTSVGYGVAKDGSVALGSALGGCAPGVVCVNIDNGFGAAAAAAKILKIAQAL